MQTCITRNIFLVPTPEISAAEHLTPLYNGTNFTLSALAQIDENVDTNITAVGTWSQVGTQQMFTSPPYLISMEFLPLTANSSKEYAFNFTFMPTDNSPFIASGSGSLAYNLTVQRKPDRICNVMFH